MGLIKLSNMFSKLTKANLNKALELTKITGWTPEVTDNEDNDWYKYLLNFNMAGEKIKGVWYNVIDEPDNYVFVGMIDQTLTGMIIGINQTTGSVIGDFSGGHSLIKMLAAQTIGDIIKFIKNTFK